MALLVPVVSACDSTDSADDLAGTYQASQFTYFTFGSGGCQESFDALSRGGFFEITLGSDNSLEASFGTGAERGSFRGSYSVSRDTLRFEGEHQYSAVWRDATWQIALPVLVQDTPGICGARVDFRRG